MTEPEKKLALDRYLELTGLFDDIQGMPAAIVQFRPEPNMWTIQEHLVHVMEAEVAVFHRYRKAIAEPGGPVIGFDQDRFTPALDYHGTTIAEALGIIKLLRTIAYRQLLGIITQDWQNYYYEHNETGSVNLETFLMKYNEHMLAHREYVDRNLRLFERRSSAGN
jgi:hypothetical protein